MTTLVRTNKDNVFGHIISRDIGWNINEFLAGVIGDEPHWVRDHTKAEVFHNPGPLGVATRMLEDRDQSYTLVELLGRTV